jgi:predicted nuclease with TOPRIM domain
MKDVRKRKQLQSQLNLMLGDAEALKIEVSNKQREYSDKLNAINRLKEEIARLDEDKNLRISEHAILRYLERVKGMDIEAIENEILTDTLKELVEKLGGNGSYPNNGFQVRIKNYTITTIV